jgi:hypothetical protein
MNSNRSKHFLFAIFFFAVFGNAIPTTNAAPDVAWQEVAPAGEEFFVTMPAQPQVSRGTRLFYLNRDVIVNFAVYALVHDKTLFVIHRMNSQSQRN